MLAVRLSDELEKKLQKYAKKSNQTKTDVVKEALNLLFKMQEEQKETPYQLGKELFGKYGSNKRNLSTTYKSKLKEKLSEKYNLNR